MSLVAVVRGEEELGLQRFCPGCWSWWPDSNEYFVRWPTWTSRRCRACIATAEADRAAARAQDAAEALRAAEAARERRERARASARAREARYRARRRSMAGGRP